MKKIYLLLGMAILLQSCYSYKPVEINPKTMAIGQVYKIEQNHKTSKVTYVSNADSAIVVAKNGKEERIAIKDITKARKRKFSLAKTLVWVPITLVAMTALLVYGSGDYDSEKK